MQQTIKTRTQSALSLSTSLTTKMSNSDESHPIPAEYSGAGGSLRQSPLATADPRVPLLNLSTVRMRMDSLQQFLSASVNSNTLISTDQMDTVSTEIVSAIHQIIVNGAALLSCSSAGFSSFPAARKLSEPPDEKFPASELKIVDEEVKVENDDDLELDCEIVELDAVELLAEHIHFCEICGKGFKRDANLRMHMRAHGNKYKTPEALAKPEQCVESKRKTRFSCPFEGCNRNKGHKKFRPLKSVICVKNHFKRSHCPKMYACNRCNRKSFSVLADLKSHLRNCGEAKWRCTCGTSFSRKDKLFGHVGLFEGHMPAVVVVVDEEEEEKAKSVMAMEEDEEEKLGVNSSDNGFLEGLFDGLGEIESYSLEDMWGMEKYMDI